MLQHSLSNRKVLLKHLSLDDADIFYSIYANPLVIQYYDKEVFFPNETPQAFTERIISACEGIWTIRSINHPDLIIGDCALHHYDKEEKSIQIGGSLLPPYWGQGYMKGAFDLLIDLARKKLQVSSIFSKTTSSNLNAIRLAEKSGFVKVFNDNNETHLGLDK